MKIIPNTTIQTNEKDGSRQYFAPGEVADLPKDLAKELVDRGFARIASDGETPADKPAAPAPNIKPADDKGVSITHAADSENAT